MHDAELPHQGSAFGAKALIFKEFFGTLAVDVAKPATYL